MVDIVLDEYAHEAAQIARDAGEILRDRFGQPHEVRFKGTIDLVTEADRAAEDLIADRLRAVCPEHDLLCEEGSVEQHRAQRTAGWSIRSTGRPTSLMGCRRSPSR